MSMDYIRHHYGVPAKRGGRVEYTGEGPDKPELGTITGARGAYLMVRLDATPTHPLPFHPTWKLRYLDASPEALPSTKGLAAASLPTIADPVKEGGR